MIEQPIDIWPPHADSDGERQWHVVVDMRRAESEANYEWSDKVKAKVMAAGLDIEADPETSCSYFYCHTEGDAKIVADTVRQAWAEGLEG